jgi:hypothetical protein
MSSLESMLPRRCLGGFYLVQQDDLHDLLPVLWGGLPTTLTEEERGRNAPARLLALSLPTSSSHQVGHRPSAPSCCSIKKETRVVARSAALRISHAHPSSPTSGATMGIGGGERIPLRLAGPYSSYYHTVSIAYIQTVAIWTLHQR